MYLKVNFGVGCRTQDRPEDPDRTTAAACEKATRGAVRKNTRSGRGYNHDFVALPLGRLNKSVIRRGWGGT